MSEALRTRAASSLRAALGAAGVPGLLSVGTRSSTPGIVVYVAQRTPRVDQKVPPTWKGYVVSVETLPAAAAAS